MPIMAKFRLCLCLVYFKLSEECRLIQAVAALLIFMYILICLFLMFQLKVECLMGPGSDSVLPNV